PPVSVRDTDEVAARVDRARDEDALLVDLAADTVDAAAGCELGEVYGDVDADQRAGDLRADALETRAANALAHAPLHALRPSGVLGTADADRRHRHALGADWASALRARQPGHAIRVSVTGPFGAFGHVRSSVVGWPFTSSSHRMAPLLPRLGSSSTSCER